MHIYRRINRTSIHPLLIYSLRIRRINYTPRHTLVAVYANIKRHRCGNWSQKMNKGDNTKNFDL